MHGIYGATSVRVDTSNDGSSWTEGATYDENDGMLSGLAKPPPRSTAAGRAKLAPATDRGNTTIRC